MDDWSVYVPLVIRWLSEVFLPFTLYVLTEGLKTMHDIQMTLDMMDIFIYLFVCYMTTAIIQDRFSIMTVQVLMLFVVGVLF